MLDPAGRRTSSSSSSSSSSHKHNHHQIHIPSDQNQINQPVPGRLSCDSYISYDIRDYGNRVRQSAEYYAKFRQSWSGPLVAADDEEDEFGFSTPPVHRNNNDNNHYRNLTPASKAHAIARGQRELMEMVSKMPESCYELSLKDIVEHQPIDEENNKQEEEVLQERKSEKGEKKKKKKNDNKMEIVKKKNGSVSNNNDGFLLKMVFPVAFGMKKPNKNDKKKSELGSYSFKVAPRPPVVERSDKAITDEEWWNKSLEKSESESSGSSSNNGNGNGKSSVSTNSISTLSSNSSRHEGGGCLSLSFLRNKKSKMRNKFAAKT